MNPKSQIDPRLAGVFGIVGPISAFTLIALAISQASWFSWTENALSDLGVRNESSLLFNGGLIVGGLLNMVFAWGMIYFHTKLIGKIGALFLLFASISLCLIGAFPETAPYNLHYIVSVAFFTLFPLSSLIQTVALLQNSTSRKLGVFTLIIAIVAIVPWAIWLPLEPYEGVAVPELVSAIAAALWTIFMAFKLVRQT